MLGAAIVPLLALSLSAPSADGETLLLQQPTISKHHVAFVYAQDLWICSRRGGSARRLTSSNGVESSPELSPDGDWVAFTGQYEGNTDVYVISVEGGAPQRLTWHPGGDLVQGWHPDGERILFSSSRSSAAPVNKLFEVNVDTGDIAELEIPKVGHAAYDDDASHIAYTPIRDGFRTWKRYRGGLTPPIWIFDRSTCEVEEIPHENASDTLPCWLGSHVYFASDRDGQMNLWRYAPGSKEPEQITRFSRFDVRNMSAGDGVIVFEQAGALHTYDPTKDATERLRIRVRSDGLAMGPRWQPVGGAVRNAAPAPNGKRAVFEARGEIITVPREHGDARNLTNSPGAHDRSPVWSPDGKQIAWFSDGSGEYELMVSDRLGREEPRAYPLKGAGFYHDPRWSPNGEHILFTDKANRLRYVTLETGEITSVAHIQGSLGEVRPAADWSPDSKWIAFESRNPRTMYDHIALYELETGLTTKLTDDFAATGSPAFSKDGKYLYFYASIDAGPKLFGLDMSSSAARSLRGSLYVAVLDKETENPLAPKSDEGFGEEEKKGNGKKDGKENGKENGKDGDKDSDEEKEEDLDQKKDDAVAASDEKSEGKDDADEKDEDQGKTKDKNVVIALDGLDQRILALPLPRGQYGDLGCTKDKLLFVEFTNSGAPELKGFDFESRKADKVMSGVSQFQVSADGKAILARSGRKFQLANANGKDAKSLKVDSVQLRVEPEEEWPQILREVWRIQRDYFYDPNMHGVDWMAMWDQWSEFLPHVQHRSELALLVRELIGELACGHQYAGGGEYGPRPNGVSVGLLGADYEVDGGRYQIARIYEGQNWNPGMRAPLTAPGVDARVGDYLIEVNGRPITSDENLYQAFENTAGNQVDIKLATAADGAEARTMTVVPLSSESGLRRQSWIESNRRRVDELSKGKLAYIYMPNTGGAGMAAFDRDFYSQLDKQGVIIDERYNGGGQVADYVIDVLSREVMSYWMNREQWVGQSPFGTLDGPKVMIINESAGSGGDWMPWTFQNRGVGPLVGKRTWGGLVGISGYPPLMDGGSVTAASFGVMDTEGQWAVENVGVAPDHEVTEWPKEIIEGRDPQLEKAVALALEALAMKDPNPRPVYVPPTAR